MSAQAYATPCEYEQSFTEEVTHCAWCDKTLYPSSWEKCEKPHQTSDGEDLCATCFMRRVELDECA